MSIMAGSASLVNQVFSKFLATLPKARSDLVPPKVPVLERTKMALRTLADLVGDSSYATRDPYSSLSFSCVSPEVAQSQLDNLRFYWKDIDKAFCPLGRDGRPMRKSVLFFSFTFADGSCGNCLLGTPNGSNHIGSTVIIAA